GVDVVVRESWVAVDGDIEFALAGRRHHGFAEVQPHGIGRAGREVRESISEATGRRAGSGDADAGILIDGLWSRIAHGGHVDGVGGRGSGAAAVGKGIGGKGLAHGRSDDVVTAVEIGGSQSRGGISRTARTSGA